jgi:hypothetical protein
MGKHNWSWLFGPSVVKLGELAHKRREARFMILAIEPCLMPSPKRSFQGKINEANTRAGLET